MYPVGAICTPENKVVFTGSSLSALVIFGSSLYATRLCFYEREGENRGEYRPASTTMALVACYELISEQGSAPVPNCLNCAHGADIVIHSDFLLSRQISGGVDILAPGGGVVLAVWFFADLVSGSHRIHYRSVITPNA